MDIAALVQRLESADDDGKSYLRSREFVKLVTPMKKARKKLKQPGSLQSKAANVVIKNRKLFSWPQPELYLKNTDKNPFANLPHPVVQELLLLAEEPKLKKVNPEKMSFLLQLLNAQVTEFDLKALDWTRKIPESGRFAIFKHLIQNCPKINRVEINSFLWEDLFGTLDLDLRYRGDLFPLMASKWPNLAYLALHFSVGKSTLESWFSPGSKSLIQTVCTNLPNLIGLKMHLILKDYTSEDIDCLSKMNHLQDLSLVLHCKDTHCYISEEEMSMVVQTTGRLPHLKNFGFSVNWAYKYDNAPTDFIQEYARTFPGKKITMDKIWIESCEMDIPWPPFVSVKELKLKNLYDYENIMAIEGPVQKLHIENMDPKDVYRLMQKLGPTGITHLTIKGSYGDGEEHRLDLNSVLAPCQNLQYVDIEETQAFSGLNSPQKIMPATFWKCEHFKLHVRKRFYNVDVGAVLTLKQYLLNSRVYLKTLELRSVNEFKAIEMVLLEKQFLGSTTCIDYLEDIHIIFHKFPDAVIEAVTQMLFLMFQQCPYLKKVLVTYRSKSAYTPEWLPGFIGAFGMRYQESGYNRYLPVFEDDPSSDDMVVEDDGDEEEMEYE